MLNNPVVETSEVLAPRNQFLVNSMPFKAVGCIVTEADSNGTDSNGKKIVKMGTPLTVDLTDRQTPGTVTTTGMPTGVLIHDVPVDGRNGNGSLLIDGGIVLEYADTDIQTAIRATDLMNPESTIKVITRK